MTTARMLRVLAPGLILASLAPLRGIAQAPPLISISDASVFEGNIGSTDMLVTLTLDKASTQEVRVNYITFPGTATGGLLSTVFTSAGPIGIPDAGPALTYPAVVNVAGIAGQTQDVIIGINGLTHAAPGDLDMLLVAPDGKKLVVQSDAGGTTAVINHAYAMHGSGGAMPFTGQLPPGTARPTSYAGPDAFNAPAPSGPHDEAAPVGVNTLETAFRGGNPNGQWKLYVMDDSPGNPGAIQSWHLNVGVSDPTKDYVTKAGQGVFAPGVTQVKVLITVNGDTTVESNETFRMNLLAPINAGIARGQADFTILNDDGGSGTPPTAVADAYTGSSIDGVGVTAASGLLANDSSNGGGPMIAELVKPPQLGILDLDPDGGFTYIAGDPAFLSDSFTYRARNQFGYSAEVEVRLTLSKTGPKPTRTRVWDLLPRKDALGGSDAIVRFDTLPAAVNHLINGGVLPGQPLVTIPTNSPFGIHKIEGVPGGSFYISAQAIDANNQVSLVSNEVRLHNTTAIAPSAPTNLLGLADGPNLTLAWRNTLDGGLPTNTFLRVTGDANLTVPLGNTETFRYNGVAGGVFNVAVFNGNAGGTSADSNVVTLTFPATCSGPPGTPVDFLLYTPAPGRIGAVWDLPGSGTAPAFYRLLVTSALFTGAVDMQGRDLDVAVPPGPYTIAALAVNSCGVSPPTAPQTVDVR